MERLMDIVYLVEQGHCVGIVGEFPFSEEDQATPTSLYKIVPSRHATESRCFVYENSPLDMHYEQYLGGFAQIAHAFEFVETVLLKGAIRIGYHLP